MGVLNATKSTAKRHVKTKQHIKILYHFVLSEEVFTILFVHILVTERDLGTTGIFTSIS